MGASPAYGSWQDSDATLCQACPCKEGGGSGTALLAMLCETVR